MAKVIYLISKPQKQYTQCSKTKHSTARCIILEATTIESDLELMKLLVAKSYCFLLLYFFFLLSAAFAEIRLCSQIFKNSPDYGIIFFILFFFFGLNVRIEKRKQMVVKKKAKELQRACLSVCVSAKERAKAAALRIENITNRCQLITFVPSPHLATSK